MQDKEAAPETLPQVRCLYLTQIDTILWYDVAASHTHTIYQYAWREAQLLPNALLLLVTTIPLVGETLNQGHFINCCPLEFEVQKLSSLLNW